MKGRKQTLCLGGRGGVTTALWTANIILALLLTRCVTLEMPPVVSYFLSLGLQGNQTQNENLTSLPSFCVSLILAERTEMSLSLIFPLVSPWIAGTAKSHRTAPCPDEGNYP